MKWQHCLSPSANSTRYWTAARANLSSSSLAGWPAQRCTWQHVRERGRYPNADWTRSGLEPNKPTAPVRTCRELGAVIQSGANYPGAAAFRKRRRSRALGQLEALAANTHNTGKNQKLKGQGNCTCPTVIAESSPSTLWQPRGAAKHCREVMLSNVS